MASNETTTSTSKTTATGTSASEFEAEEISTETTVPTDLTLSPESDFGRRKLGQGNPITKQLLERKQLLHDLQLLKIELSQKTLIIDNLKADYMTKKEDLEEKLADALHQKQFMQARLESQMKIQQDEATRRLDQTKIEMNVILKKQKELEETNAKLQDRLSDIRETLVNLELNDQQYYQLHMQDVNQLSLRDFVAMKVFEMMRIYKSEQEKLQTKLKYHTNEMQLMETSNEHLKAELEIQTNQCSKVQSKYNKVLSQLKDVQAHIRTGDFKIENYNKIKRERDKYMEEVLNKKKELSELEASNTIKKKELDDVKSECTLLQQKLVLLQQDKNFLSKKMIEVSNHIRTVEDNLSKTSLQLEKVTIAREDLYEKYIAARDIYKSEYERKLKEEMESLQIKTTSEIEGIQRAAKEAHEKELKSLKDDRDLAVAQRDKAECSVQQINEKCERLSKELQQVQTNEKMQLTNLKSQLSLKTFELEQMKIIHTENQKSLQKCQLENEKLLQKLEEFREVENKLQKHINDLEQKLNDTAKKLSVYEKLENELDDAITQAAKVSDMYQEGEKISLAFNELNLPTTTNRRLQHSFHLAKRIIYLEKQNAIVQHKLEHEKALVKDLGEELTSLKQLVDNIHKPSAYHIETIKVKDAQLQQCKHEITQLNSRIRTYESKIKLLTSDIEKLLKNREDIDKLKKQMSSVLLKKNLHSQSK